MGTRGYFVYRFRGRYYALYLQYDTYPEGLGRKIVQSIPENPEGYRCWLEAKRSFLAKWDEVLEEQILCIPSSRLIKNEQNFSTGDRRPSYTESPLSKLLDERFNEGSPTPSYIMPQLDIMIEYSYVIDLDREIFTVNNGAYFTLDEIPRNSWIESLGFDHNSVALIDADLVPEHVIVDLPSLRFKNCIPDVVGMALLPDKITTVVPKAFLSFSMSIRHGPLLVAHLWKTYKASLQHTMPWVLRGLTPDDFAFRELAFSIISFSAGLIGGVRFANGQRRLDPITSDDWSGFITGNDRRGHPIVLSNVGIGYHAEGIEPGSSPQATSYWFHGALIKLVADLTDPDRVREAIAQAIGFGRSADTTSDIFDVVLLSIEHVILLHIAGTDIQRTEMLSLLDIAVHFTDPLKRYADDFHDPRWGWTYKSNKKLDDVEEEIENDTNNSEEGCEATLEESEPEEQWPQRYRGFFAMVHLFEAVTKRAMPLDRSKEGVFPTEIYEMILPYVDDTTHRACSIVSPKFRRYCLRNLRLIEGTRICGLAPPKAHTETNTETASYLKQYTSGCDEKLLADWADNRFILDDEDGEGYGAYHLKALREYEKVRSKTKGWLTICGESERLSLINKFVFIDYEPAGLWEEEEHESVFRERESKPTPFASLLQRGDSDHFWSHRIVVEKLSQCEEITMRSLPVIWDRILAVYIPRWLGRGRNAGYELPPHTEVTLIETLGRLSETCIGYIRFKRPNAIVGPFQAWELGKSEAEEHIAEISTRQDYQPIFAIVAIGLAAELFRWDIQGQKLMPAAEKRLEIFAEGDREELEAFITELKTALVEEEEKERARAGR